MIPVKLTSVSGETKTISLPDRATVENFIVAFSSSLPQGVAINVDAPLVGIHGGWVFGKKENE